MKKALATFVLLIALSVSAFGGIIHDPGVAGHSTGGADSCMVCLTSRGAATEPEDTGYVQAVIDYLASFFG